MRAAIVIGVLAVLAANAPLHAGHGSDRVLLTGALHPVNALEIVVPTTDESQLVVRWLIADGAIVKAGDKIAELDATPFTRRLQQTRTQLASSEAQFKLSQHANAIQLADKKYAVRQQEIALAKAKLQAELPGDLVSEHVRQDNAFALSQAELDLAKAKRDLATAGEEVALDERVKRIDVDKTRQSATDLEQAIRSLVITAPRAGVVAIESSPYTNHKVRVGDQVDRGQTILTQPDLGASMEVRADLIDVDDGRVAVRMVGMCTLDAYPAAPIACTVASIAPVARVKEGHGSVRRAFAVTLDLGRGATGRLRPGLSVKVELSMGATR